MGLRFSKQTVLWECPWCLTGVIDPMPTKEELVAAYPADLYYAYSELEKDDNAHWVDRLRDRLRETAFENHLAPSSVPTWPRRVCAWLCQGRFAGFPRFVQHGRLLDVGCGDGYFLWHCQHRGWFVSGVEWNREAVSRARTRGLTVWHGDFMDFPTAPGTFEVIRMWHVVEHVEDPIGVLDRAATLLVPGGELIVGVPNARALHRWIWGTRWSGWDLPRHLHHFSARGVRLALERTGFDVRVIAYCSVGTGLASAGVRLATSWVARGASVLSDAILDAARLGDALGIHAIKR